MTDHLLRLAKLTLRLAGDLSQMDEDGRNLHAELFDFVRDLEAAPAPERSPITREEFMAAIRGMQEHVIASGGRHLPPTPEQCALACAAAWGLTVEDA